MTVWPWNHVAVAYLLASPVVRWREGEPPSDAAALAIALGALAPDLIDKPLGWVFGVVPGGRSLAHSLLVAVPLAVLVVAVARRHDREGVGLGFAVGYLSHLPLDAVGSGLIGGEPPETGFLLWPLLPTDTARPPAALPHLLGLSRTFLDFLGTSAGRWYLGGTLAVLTLATAVWWLDGRPGPEWFRRRIGRGRRSEADRSRS